MFHHWITVGGYNNVNYVYGVVNLRIVLQFDVRSKNSQVTGFVSTFLNAYTMRSKPFLP